MKSLPAFTLGFLFAVAGIGSFMLYQHWSEPNGSITNSSANTIHIIEDGSVSQFTLKKDESVSLGYGKYHVAIEELGKTIRVFKNSKGSLDFHYINNTLVIETTEGASVNGP